MNSTSISAALARFTTNLQLSDVPQTVRERARHLMLDSIGLAFATTTFNYSRITLAAMQELPPEKALFALTLAWTGARVSEVLALTAASFQVEAGVVAIVTLKRRSFSVREVPIP